MGKIRDTLRIIGIPGKEEDFIEEGLFKKLIGLTGGTFNFIRGLSAMIVPATIGYLVEGGSFKPALIFISALALMGALSYIFLVGHLKRIEIKEY